MPDGGMASAKQALEVCGTSTWHSQVPRTRPSGTLLPCLLCPSCVRQLCPTPVENASRHPPTPHDSFRKDEKKEIFTIINKTEVTEDRPQNENEDEGRRPRSN